MKKILSCFLLFAIIGVSASVIHAQRKITPVEQETELKIVTKEELKQIKDRAKAERHYADSLAKDSLKTDSIRMAKRQMHPLLKNVTVGLNIWDPLMRAFGKDYGGGSVWASLNMRNRYFPTLEFGIGAAKDTPEDGNYTYKSNPAFFAKVGANYNFMATKDERYKLYAGFHLGWTSFKYDVTDIKINDGLWGNEDAINILGQKSHAFWGEFQLGLQVNIIKNFSLGWGLKYMVPFNIKENPNSRPWYIPGYGPRDNKLSVHLNIIYEFQLKQKGKPVVENYDDVPPPVAEKKSE